MKGCAMNRARNHYAQMSHLFGAFLHIFIDSRCLCERSLRRKMCKQNEVTESIESRNQVNRIYLVEAKVLLT
ncbi:hypothetical protein PsorP6_000916 [Peronosclerospora sorghi]|uniref:Uncharacterized protein n=1 Tax=Peronosclerospora sorghi TaxID=230839 RepID=A0ACC0WU22_9STRA|nr:hypothetical protein PsorP6_000916 [Peronosclerospora sorghi]